jgi:hypothetical protein
MRAPQGNALLGWRRSSFSVHNQVRVGEGDAEGRKELAGYMLRAPMALEKTAYDADTGTVIYLFARKILHERSLRTTREHSA